MLADPVLSVMFQGMLVGNPYTRYTPYISYPILSAPINTPYQHTLSTHPINTHQQNTLSTHPSYPIISCPISTYQHTPYQHTLTPLIFSLYPHHYPHPPPSTPTPNIHPHPEYPPPPLISTPTPNIYPTATPAANWQAPPPCGGCSCWTPPSGPPMTAWDAVTWI